MKLIIDPPSGWRYGYPDVWDKEKETLEENYRRHGIPERDVEFCCQHYRCWFEPEEEDVSIVEEEEDHGPEYL